MFARYVEGCDINLIGQTLIKNAPLQICYYFAKYVENVTPIPFMKKAIKKLDKEMFIKFFNLAVGTKYHAQAEKLKESWKVVKDIKDPAKTKRKSTTRPTDLIKNANDEYKQNGYSDEFKRIEKLVLTNEVPTEIVLFAKDVGGINIKAFEEALILHGDPFTCMVACRDVPGVNSKLLLESVKFMIYDYTKINAEKKLTESELNNNYKKRSLYKKEYAKLKCKLDKLIDDVIMKSHVSNLEIKELNSKISACRQEISRAETRIKELTTSQYKMLVNECCRNIRDIMRARVR